ncbi:MAG: glycosyltransferase family A protein [Patescibacteria group bacterium]
MTTRVPKVSIILTTYNRAYILPKAIKSVLEQTYKDFELVVVDDGSIDNTKEVVESFGDERVRYVRHDVNKGLAVSRNTGLRAARGVFFAFQDSDDEWTSQKLEEQVPVLEQASTHVGVVYTRLEKTMRDASTVLVPALNFHPTSGNLYQKLLEGNFITMQVALVRRECIDRIGYFDEALNWLEDWDFWLRIAREYEFIFISMVGVRAVVMGDSLTSNQGRRLEARRKTFDKHREEFLLFPSVYARQNYRLGHAYALRHMDGDARQYLWDAMRAQPWNIKYIGAYVLVRLPKGWYRAVASVFGRGKQAMHS